LAGRIRSRADGGVNRACEVCNAPLERRPGEQLGNFRNRRTCGGECATRLRVMTAPKQRLELPAKQCPVCGGMFERRDGEPATNYRRRRTCGRACAAQLRYSVEPSDRFALRERQSRVQDVLADYRGLPLSAWDIAEELGGHRLAGVQRALRALCEAGVSERKADPDIDGGWLYYDPRAWEAAA